MAPRSRTAAKGKAPSPRELMGQELWGAFTGAAPPPPGLPASAGPQRGALVLSAIVVGNAAAKQHLATCLGGLDAALGM